MIVAVHQPHYFPWLGYLDKMAKVDKFVIYDCVQFEKSSPMCRNQILGKNGEKQYITLSYEKHGLMSKENRQVEIKNWGEVHEKHVAQIRESYGGTNYFGEIFPELMLAIEGEFHHVFTLQMHTIGFLRKMFAIDTPLVLQSDLPRRLTANASEKLVDVLCSVGGTVYLSGNGARKYMDTTPFDRAGIGVVYQSFHCPQYPQTSSTEFVPNLSALDLLFNCGIERSRRIFWDNVRCSHELEGGLAI